MTLTLTRADFLHQTRRRQLSDGRWQTVCACGWLSRPVAHPDLLAFRCPVGGPDRVSWADVAPPRPTPESIRLAKAARDAERRQLETETGCTVTEDGHVVWPHQMRPGVH